MNSFSILRILILSLALLPGLKSWAQEEEAGSPYAEQNQKCFKCHGHKAFSYFNEVVEKDVREKMNPYYIIDSALFYQSNHRNFSCTDCHSSDYSNFPHPNELRFEPSFTCLDCHDGDPNMEDIHLDKINEEFIASVHSEKHSEDFTCWMCHNPHSYRINARNTENLKETIQYDNNICLSCHANQAEMEFLSERHIYDMVNQHEWLPNHMLHFQNVRCIECHARHNDTLMVAHLVQPKEKAVKLCVECHSANSMLMASLYKYQSMESRTKQGFLNGAILSDSYVIGANRNYILNFTSLGIFGLVIVIIIIHAVLRKFTAKK